MEPFIVENAGNTCYIDSLLMGLFFDPSHIDDLLNKNLKNTLAIYLQEYIKEKFVKLIRENKSVICDDIEMIRMICFQLGWRKPANTTDETSHSQQDEEYINQQDVNEFYTFLMEMFENEHITITRNTISEGTSDKTDIGADEIMPFIPLSLPENQTDIKVSELLHNWLYDNVSDLKNNKEEIIKGLNTYYISNLPYLIGLSINRFNNKGDRIHTNVIIQKKITPHNQDLIHSNKWEFQAAICHKGSTNRSGHYYTLISSGDKWYIFNDLDVPCMYEVKMDDKIVTDMLKKECVFLLYRLPKFY